MKIELRNVKHAKFASEETNCFEATIYINGKRAGSARNDGRGGRTFIEPRECRDRLAMLAASMLPHDLGKGRTIPMTAELIIDQLLIDSLYAKDLKKLLSKRAVYTMVGKPGLYQSRALSTKADDVARVLADPEFPKKLGADKILNLLPFEEALALYKAAIKEST